MSYVDVEESMRFCFVVVTWLIVEPEVMEEAAEKSECAIVGSKDAYGSSNEITNRSYLPYMNTRKKY